jgi:hypothetical protein
MAKKHENPENPEKHEKNDSSHDSSVFAYHGLGDDIIM